MRFILTIFAFLLFACPAMAQDSSLAFCTPPVLGAIQIKEKTAGYDVDVNYPVLCSPTATRSIRDLVTSDLSTFKMAFPGHDLSDYPHIHEMSVHYGVWPAAKGRIVSVLLQVASYAGGAHPNTWPLTRIFDLATGKELRLANIFADPGAAMKAIAPMAREALRAPLGDMYFDDFVMDGTRPVEQNYQDCIINDEGVVFFFGPYRVAPYVAGQQVVTIPWEQVESLLKQEFRQMFH